MKFRHSSKRSVLAGFTALAALLASTVPLATQARDVTLEAYGRALHVHADVVHGQSLFQRCVTCHGADGHGSADGIVPDIAAQQFRVILWQLIDYGQSKRQDVRMQALVSGHDALSVQDIVDVAAFVSGLPPVSGKNTGPGNYAAHGAELFRHSCARCHGADAQGNDPQRVPKLAGQSYAYLLRQMHDAIEGHRLNFPADHVRRLAALEHNDLDGVADYLSRLPP